jgi:hypothetical protein
MSWAVVALAWPAYTVRGERSGAAAASKRRTCSSVLQVGDDFVLQDFNDAAEAVTDGKIRDGLGSRASARYAHQPEVLAHLRACLTNQQTVRLETPYRYRTTGLERKLALTFAFVPPQTVMIHAEDVTEAREVEHQRVAMAHAEKLRALGQMATGIATISTNH